jgi:uncharacterized protein YbbC (DUF1343 family)/CubicO group peptidase (beta-lactamase class C family)
MNRRDLIRTLGGAAIVPLTASLPSYAALRRDTPALPERDPRACGFTPERLAEADAAVAAAVANGVPGAVLLVARNGAVALKKVYGNAALRPAARPMAADTIFDLASLTKVVTVTTAIAILVEEGKVGLDTPVGKWLFPFAQAEGDRATVTVRHMLTHTSGVPAGGRIPEGAKLTQAVEIIAKSRHMGAPGEKFIYSDFSAVTLGAIVEAVSGKTLDVFCRERIFEPLGMKDTGFNPPPALAARCASTSAADDTPENRGIVHDPMSRALGGVSGNAGLFSTADDLARFCQMWLNGGEYAGIRILKQETVRQFTEGQVFTNGGRALGWDRDTGYSIRATLPVGSYGHTGFTGTSLWIDPTTKTFIILLTNAVHQKDASVIRLRRQVSTLVAAAMPDLPAAPVVLSQSRVAVKTGLEVLTEENFKRLEGRKVGIICNHTAVDRAGRHIVDLLADSKKVNIVALFGPEHSIRGDVDASATDSKDAKTGLPVFSLYNLTLPREQRYRPTPEQLKGVDTLIFDIQDIGARYYTYLATMAYCMEAAAKLNIRYIVLDRPNPIGGHLVEGPLLDAERVGNFTSYHTMPITHGMTVGELATLFNAEKKIGANLEVVKMPNWNRDLYYDQTGLPWVNPSPNMRSVRAAYLYPGVGFLETMPLSVGRGTDTPFEILGAPYLDPNALYENLAARNLPGVSFNPVRFTPTSSKHKGVACGGVHINLWDRKACLPSALGIHLADALHRLAPKDLSLEALRTMRGLLGSEAVINAIAAGKPPAEIIAGWSNDVAEWKRRRTPFLMYG